MTIVEMLLNQILKVSKNLEVDGIVYIDPENSYESLCEDDELVEELLNPWELNTFVTLVQLNLKN